MSQQTTPPPVAPAGGSGDKTLMLVLAYIFPLSLIPLLTVKDDPDIQWHSKHGVVLGLLFCTVWASLTILGALTLGYAWLISPLVGVAILVTIVLAIIKANQGEKLRLPGISDLADKL